MQSHHRTACPVRTDWSRAVCRQPAPSVHGVHFTHNASSAQKLHKHKVCNVLTRHHGFYMRHLLWLPRAIWIKNRYSMIFFSSPNLRSRCKQMTQIMLFTQKRVTHFDQPSNKTTVDKTKRTICTPQGTLSQITFGQSFRTEPLKIAGSGSEPRNEIWI